MKNVQKIVLFLSVITISFCLQAMIHHRIECGFIRIHVCDENIAAFDTATGNKVGELAYRIHDRTTHAKKLEIISVVVDANYQLRGVGTRLVKTAVTRAKITGCMNMIAEPDSNIFVFCRKVLKSKL